MELSKSSLCGMLLEEGDEDLAVLLARSELPEELDTDRDAATLHEIGLDAEALESLLPAVRGEGLSRPALDAEMFERTVSDRWADLVGAWVARRPGPA